MVIHQFLSLVAHCIIGLLGQIRMLVAFYSYVLVQNKVTEMRTAGIPVGMDGFVGGV